MAETENNVDLKRKAEESPDAEGNGEEEEWVGPLPNEATQTKKRKGLFVVVYYLVTLHSYQTPANRS